ncbi:hypothetical protein AwDysgo_08580 [Bacteroidales bacterium]|nr:hypothetical protein AwDysgo_08580 [Bacteroidales bacterium]
MKKNIANTSLILFLALSIAAQIDGNNSQWMDYLQELAENESETTDDNLEFLFDDLSYWSENPTNIYELNKEQLEKLPFLSAIQIENLLYYIYKNKPLASIYELKNVEDLDLQTITYLLPFIFVGDMKAHPQQALSPKMIKYGKHQLWLRSDRTFQEKAGYKKASEEEVQQNPHKYYLGENFYLSLKYGFQYKDRIQFGVLGEKDAGEAFWNNNNKGFDFYSAHLLIKDIGPFETIILGDFRASFGQGLVLNTDFAMGKTSDILNISKKNTGIKRHFSSNENNYFRGLALSSKLDNIKFSMLVSQRQLDAIADDENIYSFKIDGYHRTVRDMEKKNQAKINLLGANLQWTNQSSSLGITGIYYAFGGKTLNPELKPYNIHGLRGDNNYNIGVNYSHIKRKYTIQGETAIDKNGKTASLNTFQIYPASFLGLVISYRNYHPAYQALYGKAFSESSTIQNEQGFYIGAHIQTLKYWELRIFSDIIKFPWLKYGIDKPSEASDVLLQVHYRPSDKLSMNIRYKRKQKERNETAAAVPAKEVLPYNVEKIRWQIEYMGFKNANLKTQVDLNTYLGTKKEKSVGRSIFQSASYKFPKRPIQLSAAMGYFKTDDWNTRINIYEKNILYAFAFPSYYGHGMRYYALAKWEVSKKISVQAKLGSTHYFDRQTIGSGLETIEGNEKTDLYCLVRYTF